jgi:hypothetical protein
MGMICWGFNMPYLMAVQTFLEEQGIPVLVQDPPSYWAERSGRLLTVPDGDHDRAMQVLKEAGLDPAKADLSPASWP